MIIVQHAGDALRNAAVARGQVVRPDAESYEVLRISEIREGVVDVVRDPGLDHRKRMLGAAAAAHSPS
jgi:hypothetical protein